jgi:hypothetical protein
MFDFSQIQEKAEIFARGFLGEVEAGNLRSGAPSGGEDGAPGHGEGEDGGGQADDAPKIGEV